jgi:hypothetical protein
VGSIFIFTLGEHLTSLLPLGRSLISTSNGSSLLFKTSAQYECSIYSCSALIRMEFSGIFKVSISARFQAPLGISVTCCAVYLRFKELVLQDVEFTFPQFQSVVKASYNAVTVRFENVAILTAGTFAGPSSTEVLNAPQVACRHLSDLVFDVAILDVVYDTSFSCRLFHDIVSHASHLKEVMI